jgi:hypothetical protein
MVHFTFDAEIDLKQENLDGQVKETIDNIAFLLGRTEKDLCELNIKGNVYENKIFAEIYPEDATEPAISFYLSEDQRIINASPFIKAYRDKIAEVVSATPLLKNMLPEVPDELYLTTEQVEGLFGVNLIVLDHFGYNMSPLTLSRFECFAELLFLEREETKAVSTYKWESEHIDAEIDIPHTESPVIVEKLSIENPVDTIHAIEDKLKTFKIQIPEEGLDVIDQPVIDRAVTEAAGNADCSVTFSVSLACARAAAEFQELPLFRYLGGVLSCRIPECIYCVKEQFFRSAETGTFSGDFKQAMAALSAGDEADLRPVSDLPGTAVIPAECGTVSAALKTAEKIHRSGRTVLFRQNGSTGDDGLADLAVAANAAFLLPGKEAQTPVGNRLLRIGELLGELAEYGA